MQGSLDLRTRIVAGSESGRRFTETTGEAEAQVGHQGGLIGDACLDLGRSGSSELHANNCRRGGEIDQWLNLSRFKALNIAVHYRLICKEGTPSKTPEILRAVRVCDKPHQA
ncbi:hypothetical protein MN608_06818 [Microdochium nivale]|nr:hypothetical protein MN608_06818 [Microdochium nivale]